MNFFTRIKSIFSSIIPFIELSLAIAAIMLAIQGNNFSKASFELSKNDSSQQNQIGKLNSLIQSQGKEIAVLTSILSKLDSQNNLSFNQNTLALKQNKQILDLVENSKTQLKIQNDLFNQTKLASARDYYNDKIRIIKIIDIAADSLSIFKTFYMVNGEDTLANISNEVKDRIQRISKCLQQLFEDEKFNNFFERYSSIYVSFKSFEDRFRSVIQSITYYGFGYDSSRAAQLEFNTILFQLLDLKESVEKTE